YAARPYRLARGTAEESQRQAGPRETAPRVDGMSKPMGAIPADFSADGAMLTIGGRRVDALIEEAGDTPSFVYDLGAVARRVARFRASFPGVQLHYAIKA